MKKSGRWIIFMVALALLATAVLQALPGAAAVKLADPLAQMQAMMDEIMGILHDARYNQPDMRDERRHKVVAVSNGYFDYEAMSMSALARHWRERTPEERQRFVTLFTKLVQEVYIVKAVDAYEGQEIIFKDERIKNDRAVVYSVVVDHNIEIPVLYKLRNRHGRWLAYDVYIEGVSLIANYRRQFQGSRSYDAVIEWLERTVGGGEAGH